jgi:GR25 family glycosyltransferase involved in LPS biosynthesis
MWREFLQSEFKFALFIEDDFEFLDHEAALTAVDDAISADHFWDVVKLCDLNPKRIVLSAKFGSTKFVAYKFPVFGTQAYLLNRRAAEALLRREKIYRPVDHDISHMWEFDIKVWSVSPNPVREVSGALGGSNTIDGSIGSHIVRSAPRSAWGQVLQLNKNIRAWIYTQKMRKLIE